MNNPAVEKILGHLSHEERQQVEDVIHYLTEKASSSDGHIPEGSVATLLNRQPPRVREVFRLLSELVEFPRPAPFQPKMSEADHFELLGLDPEKSMTIKSALDGQEVAASLQDRMGTDATRKQDPISLREQIAAAMEANQNG